MTVRPLLLPALASLALLAACGGSPSAPATSAPAAPASSAAATSPAPSAPSASASPTPSAGVSVPADAAGIGDSIQYDDKVEVTVTQFKNAGTSTTLTIEIDDQGPDEIAGPVDVQVSYGSGYTAAAPVDGGTPVAVPVAAGKKATGTYVFTVPASSRGKVFVDVALGTDRDHAQFAGSVK